VNPPDDAKWPICAMHGDRHWCDNIREHILAHKDGVDIEPGLRYCVPVAPAFELYAEVSISDQMIADLAAPMSLVLPEVNGDPFGMNENLVELGMWSRGEGRMVMNAAVLDWMENRPHQCEASSHNFSEEMKLQQFIGPGGHSPNTIANNWCLAYYKMCYICYTIPKDAPPEWTAANFGLTGFSGQQQPATGRQNRTRQALQQRFGQQRAARMERGLEPVPEGSNSWPNPEGY